MEEEVKPGYSRCATCGVETPDEELCEAYGDCPAHCNCPEYDPDEDEEDE